MRHSPFRLLFACALVACAAHVAAADTAPAPAPAGTGGATAPAPDNSGINKRDRNDANPTADDQNLSEADRKVLQAVRRAVTKDDSISFTGHNVKIIAANGMITLRGPVKDAAEKARIADLARQTPGVTGVDNQLEIAP
jgi:hypothetical protein